MSTSNASYTSTNRTERSALISLAFWLEYVTDAWMIIEAAVAIGSGIAAGLFLSATAKSQITSELASDKNVSLDVGDRERLRPCCYP